MVNDSSGHGKQRRRSRYMDNAHARENTARNVT